jgi:hypothetical protein
MLSPSSVRSVEVKQAALQAARASLVQKILVAGLSVRSCERVTCIPSEFRRTTGQCPAIFSSPSKMSAHPSLGDGVLPTAAIVAHIKCDRFISYPFQFIIH